MNRTEQMNVRLAYGSAATLIFAGLFILVRADESLQTILGVSLLLAAIGIAMTTWRAGKQRDQ